MVKLPSVLLARSKSVSRREVLSLTGVIASILASGCSTSVLSNGSEGEGDTIEIMVENRTGELATIGVRVEDEKGEMLFSRVYDLGSGQLDSSAGIKPTPSTVTVFSPEGNSATWKYTPDLDIECDGEDIGITLKADGSIDAWYAC